MPQGEALRWGLPNPLLFMCGTETIGTLPDGRRVSVCLDCLTVTYWPDPDGGTWCAPCDRKKPFPPGVKRPNVPLCPIHLEPTRPFSVPENGGLVDGWRCQRCGPQTLSVVMSARRGGPLLFLLIQGRGTLFTDVHKMASVGLLRAKMGTHVSIALGGPSRSPDHSMVR